MNLAMTKTLLIIALMVGVSQFSMADPASARKTIAGIVANMSHFPSDSQKAVLKALAEDESAGSDNQMIATAVSNIAHTANAAGKDAMNQLIANDAAAAEVKALAEIVLGFNHVASAEAKAILADL